MGFSSSPPSCGAEDIKATRQWPNSPTCGLQAGSELCVRVYCTLIQGLKHYHQINKGP